MNVRDLPGFGDYEYAPNFGHPLDPRNDPGDEPYTEEELRDMGLVEGPDSDSQG